MSASSGAVRRLRSDFDTFRRSGHPNIAVQPSGTNLLEWHFVIYKLPSDTPYAGGVYHGRLVFPTDYPLAPPKVFMCTPSGRLDVNTPICLSATDFHPESWNPAWSIGSLLVGFLSFFLSEEMAVGVVRQSVEDRRRLARVSLEFCQGNPELRELFPEILGRLASNATDVETPLLNADSLQGAPGISGLGDSGEARNECWICRDETSTEALIHPCACRGSMGGVHASCVNQWVQRSSELNQMAPRCSVCHQEYAGVHGVAPGVSAFTRDIAARFCRSQVLSPYLSSLPRLCTQICFMQAYVALWARSQGTDTKPSTIRFVLVSTCFTLCLLHKALALTVSLERGDLCAAAAGRLAPEPQSRALRWLYVGERRRLFLILYEIELACIVVVSQTPLVARLPFVVYLLPVAKVLAYRNVSHCVRHIGMGLCFLASFAICFAFLAPVVADVFIISFHLVFFLIAVKYRHPLGASPHIFMANVVACLTMAPQWAVDAKLEVAWLRNNTGIHILEGSWSGAAHGNATATLTWNETECLRFDAYTDKVYPPCLRDVCVVLLVLHATLLLGGIVESIFVRRLQWRSARLEWKAAIIIALCTWYYMSYDFLVSFMMGCEIRWLVKFSTAAVTAWSILVCALSLVVDFRRWQNAHAWRLLVVNPDQP